ncbi:MAG: hypothetical protein HFI16_00680 [Lachnospiraceae bacterium]|nr:hypothetical protein [Lachnospiraceae bacterium]
MSSYQEMVERITDLIGKNSEMGKSFILVGDNSSGKSDVLHRVVEQKLPDAVYLIDSVNRTFDADRVELVSKSYERVKLDSGEVTAERLLPFHFNLQDTFKAASCIEQLYDKYKSRITEMCREFLGKEIQILREIVDMGIPENVVLIDGNRAKLSSGYQAVLRLFCEILYFCDIMEERKWTRGLVVIDEIDEYLSPKYSAQIYNFLQIQFPKLVFLATTHSLDLVKNSKQADLIILHDTEYEIYTGQELESMVSAENIFTDLFFEDCVIHPSDNDWQDERLRALLNSKIAGVWDEKMQKELGEMEYETLLPHQKMIYKQIEEWI